MDQRIAALEVGYDVPAAVGMDISEIQTPALIVDLDAFERNCARMKEAIERMGVRLRPHAKTHKSADIARYQIEHGGGCGVCCQKVSEAEALARAGIRDILVSNEVRDPLKIERLARHARIIVCADDATGVEALSAAAVRHGVTIEVLVEIECGARRCGVAAGAPAVDLARRVAAAQNLIFSGLQAYQGAAQHIADAAERGAAIGIAIEQTRQTVRLLGVAGLDCAIIGGAGTGSFEIEGNSGVYNELQCGSYIFMDADYGRIRDAGGGVVGGFENALFVLTAVMSKPEPDRAVCDAGLKALAVDSGLPVIFDRPGVRYAAANDEHGKIEDPDNLLAINDRLKLVPGHCDPTCNLYDWYVGVRGGKVETLWPVTARGKLY
ncbi:DSD1 family PLP-dependent enzyme [Mesorhizobium sp. LHD-90]|uniref:DSD1 family PLP-dependent enzyme n=1 Tax=Mesorhizobium sp. LHD-90 TaxID=3071414 RepID=UPI0027DF1C61|nr:DSD1 family PLP-dependent enzyme [Mesorhizobium sp. LHD-90]MDQ6433826.1 DSD1 family PLP-dependent enzyme [Mesorhizobium sp. LHD-90]